ncbi:hypothetical protein I3843_01G281500 [Carya illinoinensis]|nr:hypothetical protein I3843_01G281500 [Carya illinoinensis]
MSPYCAWNLLNVIFLVLSLMEVADWRGGQGTKKTRSGRRLKWIYRVRKMRVGLLNGYSKSTSDEICSKNHL